MTTFVVIVQHGEMLQAFGPYRSFKRAEGDAKAWDEPPHHTFVLPIADPATHEFPVRAPIKEPIPLVQPTVHCPICWTYGHVHRKDCKYSEAGMIHHVPL